MSLAAAHSLGMISEERAERCNRDGGSSGVAGKRHVLKSPLANFSSPSSPQGWLPKQERKEKGCLWMRWRGEKSAPLLAVIPERERGISNRLQ